MVGTWFGRRSGGPAPTASPRRSSPTSPSRCSACTAWAPTRTPHNVRSTKALLGVGFTHEGVLRHWHRHGEDYYDVNVFGMLRSDWESGPLADVPVDGRGRAAAGVRGGAVGPAQRVCVAAQRLLPHRGKAVSGDRSARGSTGARAGRTTTSARMAGRNRRTTSLSHWAGQSRRSLRTTARLPFPRCGSKRREAIRARRGDRPQSLRDCQLNPRTASTVPRTPQATTTARLPALSASDSPVTSARREPVDDVGEREDLGDVAQELRCGVDVVEDAGDEDDGQEDDVRVGRGRVEVRDHVREGDAQRGQRRHAGEREDGQLEPVLGPADAEEDPARPGPRSRPARRRSTRRSRPRPPR